MKFSSGNVSLPNPQAERKMGSPGALYAPVPVKHVNYSREGIIKLNDAVKDTSKNSLLALTKPKSEDLEPYNLFKETSPLFVKSVTIADIFLNRNYLDGLSYNTLIELEQGRVSYGNIRIAAIEKFVYDEDSDINDRLINVYSAMHNANSTVMLIIAGKPQHVKMYIGVVQHANQEAAEVLLKDSLVGNFPGSIVGDCLSTQDLGQLMFSLTDAAERKLPLSIACVTAVPSARQDGNEHRRQNLSQFIDTMRGNDYVAMFIAEPVTHVDLTRRIRGYEELYSNLAPYTKLSIGHQINESVSTQIGSSTNFSTSVANGSSRTTGHSESENRSSSSGSGSHGQGYSSNSGYSEGWSSSTSSSVTSSLTKSQSSGHGTSKSTSDTKGTNRTVTVNFSNKHIENLLEQAEMHMARLKDGQNFGFWECAAYFLADNENVARNAANAYKALLVGDQGRTEKAYINVWSKMEEDARAYEVLKYLRFGTHPLTKAKLLNNDYSEVVSPATFISGKDLPLFMGLPDKSVCGLPVVQMASFGRNVASLMTSDDAALFPRNTHQADSIRLGQIYHRGRAEGTPVNLNLNDLAKHCFITGSTGSGKSNTTYCLLSRLFGFGKSELNGVYTPIEGKKQLTFMVVEPAKGEYKVQFGHLPGINIFTAQPDVNRLLRINPFKFPERIHILEHLDRLLEIFKACWDMSAAMPALLKKAVELSYIEKGWDLASSTNIFSVSEYEKYPTFHDLLVNLRRVVDASDYSNEVKGNYKGALVSRVESLTNGVIGQMLCSSYDVSDHVLFDESCVVDLSRIGSSETKSLIMGILVMKLNEHRVANADGTNSALRHVTVLEEAHNLLPRCQGGGEGAALKEKSVEMLSNSIAEMRTYGEAFMIVDQSPSAVSEAAIRNTNTKILMRLPDAEDARTVGLSVGLSDRQIKEIAKLPMGIAVTMQSNWQEAVLVKIDKAKEYFCTDGAHNPALLKKLRSQIVHWGFNNVNPQSCSRANAIQSIVLKCGLPRDFINDMQTRVENLLYYWSANNDREKRKAIIATLNLEGVISILTHRLLSSADYYKYYEALATKKDSLRLKSVCNWLEDTCDTLRRQYLTEDIDKNALYWLIWTMWYQYIQAEKEENAKSPLFQRLNQVHQFLRHRMKELGILN